MLDVHEGDLRSSNVASCQLDANHQFNGRTCRAITTEYKSASESPEYRKSITFIDEKWNIPLRSEHFEWPRSGTTLAGEDLDKATLIESYTFTDIEFERHLTDDDFDRKNPDYRFR